MIEGNKMRKYGEPCILEDRLCIECGECDVCELDPNKICDNCCKCIESTTKADYAEIQIDDILINTESLKNDKGHSRNTTRLHFKPNHKI